LFESVLFRHIQQGHFGDVPLDDLSFVRVGRWEGDLWAGKVKGGGAIFICSRSIITMSTAARPSAMS
jgi:hypothetical protein